MILSITKKCWFQKIMTSYHDREKRRQLRNIATYILGCFFVIGLLFFFRNPLGNFFSFSVRGISSGISYIPNPFSSFFSYLHSKKTLQDNNVRLEKENAILRMQMDAYRLVLDENTRIKEALGQLDSTENILGTVISKPSQTPYDTILINVGAQSGVVADSLVYVQGMIPVGTVSRVFETSSIVTLFSTPGQKTVVRLEEGGGDFELIGRGGGNFELELPRDALITQGAHVYLPGMTGFYVATVGPVVSDPRDPYKKVLLTSPVNINQLTEVFIRKIQ